MIFTSSSNEVLRGKLVFERQSLGEICRYLSRWYDIRIDISPALAHVREKMPAWANEDEQQIKKPTPEQLERLRQRLARRKKSGGSEGDESK